MHSKKHRQVRKLKLRSKSKSRRGRSLKGGAKPYMYEGVSLVEGNSLIQLAVTQMDDGTYTFNPMGQHCTNYCELENYYCGKKPLALACVNPIVIAKNGTTQLKYPSLIQLLGLSLILAKSHEIATLASKTITSKDISDIVNDVVLIAFLKNKSPFLKPSVIGECASYKGSEFFKISGISEAELYIILATMKKLMFYSKYTVVADNNLTDLTFANILDTNTDIAIVYVRDQAPFRTNIAATNFVSKRNMFRPEKLQQPQENASL